MFVWFAGIKSNAILDLTQVIIVHKDKVSVGSMNLRNGVFYVIIIVGKFTTIWEFKKCLFSAAF